MSKKIVFYPVMSGVGNKYVTVNMAHLYKKMNSNKKVIAVDFDFKSPYLASYITDFDTIHSLDNLIEKIDGDVLSNDIFEENVVKMKTGLEVLKGTNLKQNHTFIEKRHIERVLEIIDELYDVAFIAVSNLPDNSGTTTALFNADEIVVVSRNNFSCYKSATDAVSVINTYRNTEVPIKWIYNQYMEDSTFEFADYIQELGAIVCGLIPYDEETVDNQDLKSSFIQTNIQSKLFKNNKNEETPFDEFLEKSDVL